MAALAIFITDVHAIGPQQAQGLLLTTAFYWDRTPESRSWSKRFFDKHGAMPTMSQAGVYSAVTHYLKAIADAKTDDAGKVVAQMKATPINDMFATGGTTAAWSTTCILCRSRRRPRSRGRGTITRCCAR